MSEQARAAEESFRRLARRPLPAHRPIVDRVRVSFEFFPPASEAMSRRLWQAIERLAPLAPSFVSVTYGAGGSTRDRTHAVVRRLVSDTTLPPAAHLTCVGATRAEVDRVVRDYRASGVRHVVALRGDPPSPGERFVPHPGGYRDAAELVAGIRGIGDVDVSVAAYPEVHPEAANPAADLDHLKRKIDAGASRAITQFFFEPDTYLRFLDRARAAGISVPIVPGILPVTNFGKVREFARRCGASVPGWLDQLFEGLDDAPDIRSLVAATVTAELVTRLRDQGVSDFHFYTLNRAELVASICHILGLRPRPMGGESAALAP